MFLKSAGRSGVAKVQAPFRSGARNQRPDRRTYHCFPAVSKKTSDSVLDTHCSEVFGTFCSAGVPLNRIISAGASVEMTLGAFPSWYRSGGMAARESVQLESSGKSFSSAGSSVTEVQGLLIADAVNQ